MHLLSTGEGYGDWVRQHLWRGTNPIAQCYGWRKGYATGKRKNPNRTKMRKFEFQAELFVEQEMDGVSLSNVDGMNV